MRKDGEMGLARMMVGAHRGYACALGYGVDRLDVENGRHSKVELKCGRSYVCCFCFCVL